MATQETLYTVQEILNRVFNASTNKIAAASTNTAPNPATLYTDQAILNRAFDPSTNVINIS